MRAFAPAIAVIQHRMSDFDFTSDLPGAGQPITVSERAAKEISRILTQEGAVKVLRIAVEGGGCSGFQYSFNLDESRSDDLVLERDGATVVIDPLSQQYLGGSEIDFVDDLIGSSFQIKNPNATAQCGCGTSFSV